MSCCSSFGVAEKAERTEVIKVLNQKLRAILSHIDGRKGNCMSTILPWLLLHPLKMQTETCLPASQRAPVYHIQPILERKWWLLLMNAVTTCYLWGLYPMNMNAGSQRGPILLTNKGASPMVENLDRTPAMIGRSESCSHDLTIIQWSADTFCGSLMPVLTAVLLPKKTLYI